MTLLSRRLAWQKRQRTEGRSVDLRVSVLSTFTANPIVAYLGSALCDVGFEPSIDLGPFDQIRQQLYIGGDVAASDVVVVWPRFEDLWAGGPTPLVQGDSAEGEAALLALGEICVQRATDWGATFVVVLPAIPHLRPLGVGDAGNRYGVVASATRSREQLRSAIGGCPGVLLFDADEVMNTLGLRQAIDHRRLAAATIPYTEEAFALAADRLANLIRIERKGARKVAVVDADNTLWGGVVGEEGASGVDLSDQGPGFSYRQFQRYLVDLRRSGMLVAIASKNNESDAFEALNRREMVLTSSDFAARRIDWNPKSSNIRDMADELNLGESAMVFIDDSALEIAEVQRALPEVATIQMPSDPAGWFAAIAQSGYLDRLVPTTSDLERAASYSQEVLREQAKAVTNLDDFLASLHLKVALFAPQADDLARLAQLVAKTNQFTLGGVRHTEAMLARMLNDPSVEIRLAHVVDDFGDYGIVGAMILTAANSEEPVLDSFVLSCRAMGRGVEDAMLADASELAGGRLRVTVLDGPKNQPLRTWMANVGLPALNEAQRIGFRRWPSHVDRATS